MSSLPLRRYPCRTRHNILELNKPVSGDKASILHSKETAVLQHLNSAESHGLKTAEKEKPQATNHNALPDLSACLQKSAEDSVSLKSHELELMVPQKITAPKCPLKISCKGRKKKDIQPSKKDVAASKAYSDELDNSEQNSCSELHSQKNKQTHYRHSKKTKNNQTPSDVSTELHTCTTSPLLDKISSYTNADCSSIPRTPKRGRPRTRPLFCSTPTSDFQLLSPKRAKNSCTQRSHQTPPTDITPSRPQRPGRTRGRKKKNLEEHSSSMKQCWESATSDLDASREEPDVQMQTPNEAHVDTQKPEPPTDVTPSRPQRLVRAGRTRGHKKKNLEEQPISSPSVKQCRKSATSDQEAPPEELVETQHKAHVETQMPEPPTNVITSNQVRPQRLVATGRTRGCKKRKVEEQPVASPSVKQRRKNTKSDLEASQKELVETLSANEAHVETQMLEPPMNVTTRDQVRPQRLVATGRTRGCKKRKVEEQPIASPSVKQRRKNTKSDLEASQKELVETLSANEAHVETQMQEPPTNVTTPDQVRPQRLVATGRTRGCKKLKLEEQPIASPSVKQSRKSAISDLEAPQEEPVETSHPNKCHIKTQLPESQESDQNMSSDLSIELSLHEEPLKNSFFEEEDDDIDDDDEELPSFLQQDNKKPMSISEGLCVWCKLRKYPYWPAVVKSVRSKIKKASIVFIDCYLLDQKRIRKGFSVSLRTLKPFDCEECEHLVDIAKEKYGNAINWSLELISDYRIRIGCGSFSGSFIEYCAADISFPLRRKYSEGKSLLTFPSQEILDEQCDSSDNNMEDIVLEEQEEQDELLFKKVLPDRSKAARNRDNKQLVDFIIRRKVENRLLAVISGHESSKWMQALQKPSRPVVDVYLEDEEQVDKVYRYLNKVCDSAPQIKTCLENIQADRIRLILDVLLPEAIIYAIAGVHKLSLEKAEEKYRRGPCFSNRERQEFDMMIEQQMKLKEITRK